MLAIVAPGFAGAVEGEQVVSGEATFTRDGSLTLITTGTPQTIVNYTSFDIGLGETVRIDQPDATSRILNNVLSTDPTLINGVLTSNGQVWIANPVGVFFGDQAIVDVGRLVAGAGKVDAAEFIAGVERWSELTGRVEVASGAQIRAADSVLLVGAAVANYGNISAADGMIALVAGGEVRFRRVDGRVMVTADRALAPDPERWGVTQAGTLDAGHGSVSLTAGDAYSLAINHTGITRASDIAVAGGDGGVVSVSGALDASDRSAGATGGAIAVTGDRVALLGAQLDASGDAGGGSIRVGGDLRGEGELPTAQRTYVDHNSSLRADAISTGDGGTIIVWSDEATRFYGALSARGGALGGDGGFAEISGASLESRGSIDLGAAAGSAGTLLYDPKEIEIVGGTATGPDGSDSPDTLVDNVAGDGGAGQILFADLGDLSAPFRIYESEIEGTNANVVLEATHRIDSSGTFDHDAAGEGIGVVQIMNGNSLTLRTRNDADDATDATDPIAGIDLTGVSFQTTGSGAITLATGTGSDTGVQADIHVGNFTTAGGAVTASTEGGDITVANVTTSSTGDTGAAGGNVTLAAGGTGSVTAGSIHALGGTSTTGDGGRGGNVAISALNGSIDVGEIDVSGGDGTAHLVDDGHGGQIGAGQGGSGGTINLVADIDPQSTAAAVPGDPREITVTGDLSARGGRGLGTATSAGTVYGAAGGTGGQILISAGTRAAEAGAGSIVLGSAAVPIEIDASGGHGTARGGSAAAGGTSALTGATIDAIRIEANDDVTAHAVLAATGGFAGIDASSAVGLPPGGFDPTAAPKLGPGGFGGSGGNVSIESKDGNVTLNDVPSATAIVVLDGGAGRSGAPVPNLSTGAFHFDGQGGSAGSLTVAVAGASRATPTDPFVGNSIVVNGPVSALGGAGTNGAGGAGGSMTLTAADGGVTFAAADPGVTIADLRGGSGTGSVSFTRTDGVLVEQEVRGGNGGGVFLTANAATGTDAAGGGNVVFTGTVDSTGGDAFLANGTTPNPPNDGTGGTVRLTSAKAITARVGDARVDNFEVVVSKVAGTVDVLGDGIDADGSGSASTHTITNLVTTADSPHFTYRLADGGSGAADEVDINTLAVGNATLGAQGVTIANARADATASDGERLLGKIQGVAGTQVNTAGKLQLFATNIGDATPLSVAGTGGTLEVTVVGNIGRLDDSQSIRAAGLVLDMPGSTVDVTQRSAAGDTVIDFPGGDADDVVIDGSVVDDGASRTETSLVKEVTTTAGTGFFYTLANPTASADDAGRAEPKLRIARGAVKLGGDVGFATIGDLILESAAEPTADPGTAIVANGHSVSLTADADGDGGGAIIASTRGETDVADATKLVALAGSGVGSATELRTSGASAVELIGRTKTGDFHVVHTGTGALTIIPLATDEDGVPSGGVQATTGDVVLSDAAGGITLGGAQPAGVTSPVAHVLSGGDQDYTGALRVAAASVTTAGTTVSGAALRAGGKIDFVDAITADALGRSLEITAGGTTTFAGDVGTSSTPLGALKVSDALFAGDRSVWLGSRGDFQAINGTGLLALNASETDSELVFRGDIGVAGDFLANADLLSFDDNANHIAAGSVSLNTAPPATRAADRFQFATIADSSGGLVIEGTREVTMGAGEKLSSAGPLVIHAGTDASLGDLSATELSVDAPTIKILGRAPGPVALANGGVVQDFGVDWVANNITTNVVPQWDEEPGTTRPTFVLGSGGIRTGGIIPFDVIRFTSDGDKIRPSSFTGSNDRILDLTGLGPRAVSDARSDVPRATPPVLPGLAARAGDEPPSPPREISSDELIGALHCRTTAGDPCAPPAVGDDPLASERALEIRQRYRALLADDQAQQSLRIAFAPAASVPAGDAAALSRALAHDPALGAARARVADLAVALAQVELLGLGAPESERARRAIAADFAAATGVAGLDADAVLAAVDASGVAVLP